jgi:hypothetical protein
MNGAYYTLHDVFHKKVQIYMQYGILVEIAVSKAICNIIFAAGLPFIPQPLWYIEPCLGSMGFHHPVHPGFGCPSQVELQGSMVKCMHVVQ